MAKINVHSLYSVNELQLVNHSDIPDRPPPSTKLNNQPLGTLETVYLTDNNETAWLRNLSWSRRRLRRASTIFDVVENWGYEIFGFLKKKCVQIAKKNEYGLSGKGI